MYCLIVVFSFPRARTTGGSCYFFLALKSKASSGEFDFLQVPGSLLVSFLPSLLSALLSLVLPSVI